MSRWPLLFVVSCVGVAMLLAACGGDDSTSAKTAAPAGTSAAANGAAGGPGASNSTDPCSLVNASDLAGFFNGETFNAQPAPSGCSYVGTASPTDTIQLNLSEQKRDLFDSVKKNDKAAQDVSGIGEAAYMSSRSDTLVTLHLYKNGKAVQLTLDSEGDSAAVAKTPVASRKDAIQKVAKAVAGRL